LDFYKGLSPYYDEMTNFEKRLQSEQEIYKTVFQKFPAKKILDAGCGSGFLSILLSQHGFELTGCDNSKEMLALARKNAKRYSVSPRFIFSDFLSVSKVVDDHFDAVFCIGNSFVHLLTADDQNKALENFYRLLVPGGYLFLQILNYDQILRDRPNIFSVKNMTDKKITRAYRFNQRTIQFIITINYTDREEQFITELYPLKSGELRSLLRKTGFDRIQIYGNLNFNRYYKNRSENICVFCYK